MDMLGANQNQALAALTYWMDSIDGLLDDANNSAIRLRELGERDGPGQEKVIFVNRLARQYSDAINNLHIFIEFCGFYVNGESHKIIEHKKPIAKMDDAD